MIQTERLILRRWRDADRESYLAMMLNPQVSDWLGGPFTKANVLSRIAKSEASLETYGYGRMAMERRSDGAFVGYCGLLPTSADLPFVDGFEAGWSVVHAAWGQGYAPEAARAVVGDAFTRLGLDRILAFMGEANLRSQAVARKLDMQRAPDQDFDHPGLAVDHPLKRHVVYVATKA